MTQSLLQLSGGPDAAGLVLRVAGELDAFNAERLLERGVRLVDDAARTGTGLVSVQLDGLRFCDAAGLDTLVALRAAADAAGVRLLLLDVPARLQRLLHLTDLDHLLSPGPPG